MAMKKDKQLSITQRLSFKAWLLININDIDHHTSNIEKLVKDMVAL